jgi:glycosyltransferase involved in cell wall biosynthesis
MIVLVICALNEGKIISSLIERSKPYVSQVIVVDSKSNDDTASRARESGAEVVEAPSRRYRDAVATGMRKALDYPAKTIVIISADFHYDASIIRIIAQPVMDGVAPIATSSKDNLWAFSPEISKELLNDLNMFKKAKEIKGFLRKSISVAEIPFIIDIWEPGSSTEHQITPPHYLRHFISLLNSTYMFSFVFRGPYFWRRRVDEYAVEVLTRSKSTTELNRRRIKIQQKIAQTEANATIYKTFMQFLPPAVFSFVVSSTILAPLAGYQIGLLSLAGFVLISASIFAVSCLSFSRYNETLYRYKHFLDALDAKIRESHPKP